MLAFLPSWLRGGIGFIVFSLNTILWSTFIYIFVIIKILAPTLRIKNWSSRTMTYFAEKWIDGNNRTIALLHHIEWDVDGVDGLDSRKSYLICANHQSWTDIVVLQKIFNRRIPFIRFFLKSQLKYVPLLGLAWWALDFPFMNRYTKKQLIKNPKRKGADLRATRKACEKYKNNPVAILNFIEGTRFSSLKHQKSQSTYRHLLEPKMGGLAFVIQSMGDQFDSLLDVTIFYPEGAENLWGLFCGRVNKIIVRVRQIEIPHDLVSGNEKSNHEEKVKFAGWVRSFWKEKDHQLDQLCMKTHESCMPY